MKKTIIVAIIACVCSHSFALYATDNKPVERVMPFNQQDVVLKPSWIKEREELNTVYLKSLDTERLLHNFRVTAGLPSDATPLGGWEAPGVGLRGHFVGHYLSAVSTLVEKYKDPLLSERLTYLIDELAKCQQALGNGYLSAFPATAFNTLETKFTGVWAPYYTYQKIMQGLLDAYLRTANTKAYTMLLDMASYVDQRMSKLSRETIEKMMYTAMANPQNEMGAMNELLYKLYKISADPKHLALAELFDPEWFLTPLSQNEDILSGLHSNTHLVLVNGFAERYAITREEKYHRAVVQFWDMLLHGHAYANGSSSGPRPIATTSTSVTAEHWGEPSHLCATLSKEIAESCVSHNTQKLTSYLFSWTADPAYTDVYMNMFYNAVLPTQSNHSGSYVYHLPLGSPRNKKYLKENDFFCCSGSSIEAFSQLNSGIYWHKDSELWVNLYVPSEVNWKEKKVQLAQDSYFPKDTTIHFTISTKQKSNFNLKLFIPAWAKEVEVYVNKEKLPANVVPASYLDIERTWRDKDEVELVFHYDFHLKAMPDNPKVFALYYGPILLAFETNREIILKGNRAEEVLKNLSVADRENGIFRLANDGNTYSLRPFFDIDKESYGVYATIRNY